MTIKDPCTLFCEYLAIPTCACYMHGIDRLPVNACTFWYRSYASPVPPSDSKYLTCPWTTTRIECQVPPGPQSGGSNRSRFGVSNDTKIMFWRRQQRVDVSIATVTHALKDGAFARCCPGNGATRHAHDTLRISLCSPTHGATVCTQW